MQIDRILYPITSLGPGDRLVIWTIGCTKYCHGCANPELWQGNTQKNVDVTEFVDLIRQMLEGRSLDGITITGGDPLEQIEDLVCLLPLLREMTDDILLYTGYTLEEVTNILDQEYMAIIKRYASVLIDGVYIDEHNDNECVLRGSANQIIHFFDDSKRELYSVYMSKGRSVQNVFYNNIMISVGIHNRDL